MLTSSTGYSGPRGPRETVLEGCGYGDLERVNLPDILVKSKGGEMVFVVGHSTE